MGLFPEKNKVGLYIDSETISVVNGQVAGPSITVAGFAELRAPTFLETSPEAKQKTLQNIRTALSRAGVKSNSVSVAVPGDGSMIRHFELPPLPKKEERNAVRFEAQKYVPFEAKTLYYDYETYPDTESKRNRVVYFACKKQWVDSLSALLTLAGMKIAQVELVSQSIARAFHRHAAKKADEVALVLLCNDQDTAELIVQKNGSVLTTRHLSLARVADGPSLDIPMLVSDVRISLDYFSENFKDMKVERLYLVTPFSGETSTVCEALQKEFSLPADTGNLFQPPGPAVSTAGAVAAYGLTLGAIEKKGGRRRISLKSTEVFSGAAILTWEEEKKQLKDIAMKEILGIAAVFVAIFFLISLLAGKKSQELRKAVEPYPKSHIASLTDTRADLEIRQAQMAQKTAFFNALADKRVYFTTKMNELAATVPPNIRLSKWSYTDELNLRGTSDVEMSLEGYVLSPDSGSGLPAVNKWVSDLIGNKDFMQGFSGIVISHTGKANVDGQRATRFTLTSQKNEA